MVATRKSPGAGGTRGLLFASVGMVVCAWGGVAWLCVLASWGGSHVASSGICAAVPMPTPAAVGLSVAAFVGVAVSAGYRARALPAGQRRRVRAQLACLAVFVLGVLGGVYGLLEARRAEHAELRQASAEPGPPR